MDKTFHLDIITPISIESFENVSYLRIPSIDGLTKEIIKMRWASLKKSPKAAR